MVLGTAPFHVNGTATAKPTAEPPDPGLTERESSYPDSSPVPMQDVEQGGHRAGRKTNPATRWAQTAMQLLTQCFPAKLGP